MTDTAIPRNEAAERLREIILAAEDGELAADIGEDLDAALAHERQQGREDAAKRVTARLIAEAMEDAIDHDDAARILRDAIASPSEEPKE